MGSSRWDLKLQTGPRLCFYRRLISSDAVFHLQVVRLEHVLGFFWEEGIQGAALQWPQLVRSPGHRPECIESAFDTPLNTA